MSYFKKMLDELSSDNSYNNIVSKIINVFSPYVLCKHFIGSELWHWGMLYTIPFGKNDINLTNNLSIIVLTSLGFLHSIGNLNNPDYFQLVLVPYFHLYYSKTQQ